MNHEHPKHRREPQPRIGDPFINHLIEAAPSPHAATRIRDEYDYHGTALAAFLGLDDVDPYTEAFVLDFPDCFHGTYTTMDDLIDAVIDDRGWLQILDEIYQEHPELEYLLTLDREGVRDLIGMRFDVVDLGDLYVFEK